MDDAWLATRATADEAAGPALSAGSACRIWYHVGRSPARPARSPGPAPDARNPRGGSRLGSPAGSSRPRDGAFDPTIGHQLEARGFNRSYRTAQTVDSGLSNADVVSYRDLELDPTRQTITLRRPLVLDLGAVAKGVVIDLAARELASIACFAVDAGGDLYVHGPGPDGERWRIGIRHPRRTDHLVETLALRDAAICTSGDYERRAPTGASDHHILDPRTGRSPIEVARVTVVAPTATAADALSTTAFILGPVRGRRFLEQQEVEGLIITPALERRTTRGWTRLRPGSPRPPFRLRDWARSGGSSAHQRGTC